jgi:hypothetical protein
MEDGELSTAAQSAVAHISKTQGCNCSMGHGGSMTVRCIKPPTYELPLGNVGRHAKHEYFFFVFLTWNGVPQRNRGILP